LKRLIMNTTTRLLTFCAVATALGVFTTAQAQDRPDPPRGPSLGDAKLEEGQVVASVDAKKATTADPKLGEGAMTGDKLMYTTYFYTANEAVVHGYEAGTNVRIVDIENGGTIWKGTVGDGETKLVPTGKGVFGFLSDKKASILVGTPSRCAVVGYWVRDREGTFRSNKFYTQLPGTTAFGTERVIVWAWETSDVVVKNRTTGKTLHSGKISGGSYFEIPGKDLSAMGNHVIEVQTKTGKNVSVQVYYDEGFYVPGKDGRLAGTEFRTFVGGITNSVNDLQLFSYGTDAKVKVEDLKEEKVLFEGVVKGDTVKTLTLSNKYVQITSNYEISVAVSPYEHYKTAYMEHHFAGGQEGTGIEGNFLVTTPQEIWVFSYFNQNPVTITDMKTGKEVWKGTLQKGQAFGAMPGHGYYRVRAPKGLSVMGGAFACGAEFSPAGGLFSVDEELMKVVCQIKEERIERAKKEGRKITEAEINAPLSSSEKRRARRSVNTNTSQKSMSQEEVDDRLDSMNTY